MKTLLNVMLFSLCVLMLSSCRNQKHDDNSNTESVPAVDLSDSMANRYKLGPDDRFLKAIGDIHHILSGSEIVKPSVEFLEGRWKISYRDSVVGEITQNPDFPEFIVVLMDWSSRLHRQYPLKISNGTPGADEPHIDSLIESYQPHNLARAAAEAGQLWNHREHTSAQLVLATRALVGLEFELLDKFEIADAVPARALALLAMTKSLANAAVEREECLLSYSMGYSRHALRLASSLTVGDPVRSFVEGDERQLLSAAERKDGTPQARFLYLSLLSRKQNPELFWKSVQDNYTDVDGMLLVCKAGLDMSTFTTPPLLSEALPRIVLFNIAEEVSTLPDIVLSHGDKNKRASPSDRLLFFIKFADAAVHAKTSTLMNYFESGIGDVGKLYQGPFIDAEFYQSFYKGYFFSSFYVLGLHYLDRLSSTEASQAFSSLMGVARWGVAADIERWYGDLAKSKAGALNVFSLTQDVGDLQHLGAPAAMRTVDEEEKYFVFGDAGIYPVIKALAAHMDTRPSHRMDLANRAYSDLYDLNLAQQLVQSVLTTSAPTYPHVEAWLAQFTGDTAWRNGLLDSNAFDFTSRTYILSLMASDSETSVQTLMDKYSELLQTRPGDYNVNYSFAQYLNRVGMHDRARSVLRRWLALNVPTEGLERVVAKTEIARSYVEEKKLGEALDAIQEPAKSWQSEAMEEKAEILARLGRSKEAEKTAMDVLARYPDNPRTRLALASFYWSQGRYPEATRTLKDSRQPIRPTDWQLAIAPKFAEVFASKPREEVAAAFGSLLAQGFPPSSLQTLGLAFQQAGRHDIAFDILARLRAEGQEQIMYWTRCYGELRALQGKSAATLWLRRQLTPNLIGRSAIIFYEGYEYDPLWEVIDQPDSTGDPDFVWLMRAAAALRSGKENSPHWSELIAHYQELNKGYYNSIGRFLVGLQSQQTVISLATEPQKVCEVSYYVGLRAQAEGRLEDASRWYHTCLETGLSDNGEYHWAVNALYSWYATGKSLLLQQQEAHRSLRGSLRAQRNGG